MGWRTCSQNLEKISIFHAVDEYKDNHPKEPNQAMNLRPFPRPPHKTDPNPPTRPHVPIADTRETCFFRLSLHPFIFLCSPCGLSLRESPVRFGQVIDSSNPPSVSSLFCRRRPPFPCLFSRDREEGKEDRREKKIQPSGGEAPNVNTETWKGHFRAACPGRGGGSLALGSPVPGHGSMGDAA